MTEQASAGSSRRWMRAASAVMAIVALAWPGARAIAAEADPVLARAEANLAVLPGATDEVPAFIREWKAFAETSGNPADKRWADLISQPGAIKLSNAWSKWRGFDAPRLVEEARSNGTIPKELKPGLVIDASNIDSIPGIKNFMQPWDIDRVKDPSWFRWKNIRIIPTSHYYMSSGKLRALHEEKGEWLLDRTTGTLKIKNCTTCDPAGPVPETWGQKSVAIPFVPKPKDGLELVWAYLGHNVGSDTMIAKPIDFILCNSKNEIERTYSAHVWWMNFWGRGTFDPKPFVPGTPSEDFQAGSIFFIHPMDVKGLAGARTRHFDPKVEDSFKVFLPTLRRTRVMTGSDTQDPLCGGCDLIWDDWRSYWQFPDLSTTEFTLEGEGFVLAMPEHGLVSSSYTMDQCSLADIEMEIRPVWILHIKDKTGKYVYAERRVWIDKDWWDMQEEVRYDRRQNMWRAWQGVIYWDPRSGESTYHSGIIYDPINHHVTMVQMHSDFRQAMTEVRKEYFDIETLKNYQ